MPTIVKRRPIGPPRSVRWLVNTMMRGVLQSPLHRFLSTNLLLLTYQGRKSGRSFTIPLGYLDDGEVISVFTNNPWWKNLRNSEQVQLHLRGQQREARVEVVTDARDNVAAGLLALLQRNPSSAPFFQVTIDPDGQPNQASATWSAQDKVMIRMLLIDK